MNLRLSVIQKRVDDLSSKSLIAIGPNLLTSNSVGQPISTSTTAVASHSVKVNLNINGEKYAVDVDPRVTLLDRSAHVKRAGFVDQNPFSN